VSPNTRFPAASTTSYCVLFFWQAHGMGSLPFLGLGGDLGADGCEARGEFFQFGASGSGALCLAGR